MSVRVMVVLTVLVGLLALGGGVALANAVGPVAAWPATAQHDGWLSGALHGSMLGDADHDAMHESVGGVDRGAMHESMGELDHGAMHESMGELDHGAMHESMRSAMPTDQREECDEHHAATHGE